MHVCVQGDESHRGLIAGAKDWQQKSRKAYGISMSLYDQHPITGKISGNYYTTTATTTSVWP